MNMHITKDVHIRQSDEMSMIVYKINATFSGVWEMWIVL